jgi:hypothetical protein
MSTSQAINTKIDTKDWVTANEQATGAQIVASELGVAISDNVIKLEAIEAIEILQANAGRNRSI